MQKLIRSISILCLLFVAIGCSNDPTSPQNTTPLTGDYFPLTMGSSWSYVYDDGTYDTLTVSEDTTFKSKQYMIMTSSSGNNDGIFRRDGNTVYTLLPNEDFTDLVEAVLLKEVVGATWDQNFSIFGIETKMHYTAVGTLPSFVSGGITYTDILRVHCDIDVLGVKTSAEYYYGKGVGLIAQVDPAGQEGFALEVYSVK